MELPLLPLKGRLLEAQLGSPREQWPSVHPLIQEALCGLLLLPLGQVCRVRHKTDCHGVQHGQGFTFNEYNKQTLMACNAMLGHHTRNTATALLGHAAQLPAWRLSYGQHGPARAHNPAASLAAELWTAWPCQGAQPSCQLGG